MQSDENCMLDLSRVVPDDGWTRIPPGLHPTRKDLPKDKPASPKASSAPLAKDTAPSTRVYFGLAESVWAECPWQMKDGYPSFACPHLMWL